jgi:hypothetical protein
LGSVHALAAAEHGEIITFPPSQKRLSDMALVICTVLCMYINDILVLSNLYELNKVELLLVEPLALFFLFYY